MKALTKTRFTALLLTLLLAVPVFASSPTVTVTKVDNDFVHIYEASWTTSLANTDSAFVYNAAGNPFDLGYMLQGSENTDSTITLHLETTETTADSVRLTGLVQVSYADSPAGSNTVNDDWVTVATLNDTNAVSFLDQVKPFASGGHPVQMRLIYLESDTNKDASQTFTLRVVVPKERFRSIF